MATQNQIAWMRNVEERRHNYVSELLDRYRTDKTYDSNIYSSNMSYAGTKYSADKHYAGTKYSADHALAGTIYGADKNYAGTIYSADSRLAGTKYSADKSYAGTIYSSNMNYAGTKYSADKHYEGTKYSADTQWNIANATNAMNYMIAQERNQNSLVVQGISKESAKYVADKNYAATRAVPEYSNDPYYVPGMSVSQYNVDKQAHQNFLDYRAKMKEIDNKHGESIFSTIVQGIADIIPF